MLGISSSKPTLTSLAGDFLRTFLALEVGVETRVLASRVFNRIGAAKKFGQNNRRKHRRKEHSLETELAESSKNLCRRAEPQLGNRIDTLGSTRLRISVRNSDQVEKISFQEKIEQRNRVRRKFSSPVETSISP